MAIVGPSISPWPAGPQLPGFYLYNIRTFDSDGWVESITPQVFRQTVAYNFDGQFAYTAKMIKDRYRVKLCNGQKLPVKNRVRIGGLAPGSAVRADYEFGGYSGYLGYSTSLKYYDGNTPKYKTISSSARQGGRVPTHVTVDGRRFRVTSATVDVIAVHSGRISCAAKFTSLRVSPGNLR